MSDRSAPVERFRDFARSPDLDLWQGALLTASLVDPREDLALADAEIERLAARVLGAGGNPPGHGTLARVLFTDEGFCGDTESYDDPANSSVARVLAKKTGMPITLSIVTLEVGRRAGLHLTGVGLPGHFVVGGPDLPEGLYLDPFDGGRLCEAGDLARRVSAMFGTPIDLPAEVFVPDSPRSILLRVLFNLRRSWERRDCFAEALAAIACAEMLAPEDATLLRERGLLLLRAGRSQEALAALETYVRVAQGEDAEAIGKLVATVSGGLASRAGELIAPEPSTRRIFTFAEAREMLPRVAEITADAVLRYARLPESKESEEERQRVVRDWVNQIASLGAEIKGLWLVDFDSGSGYYCWRFPEPALEYFHGYEEGFAGRLPLQ